MLLKISDMRTTRTQRVVVGHGLCGVSVEEVTFDASDLVHPHFHTYMQDVVYPHMRISDIPAPCSIPDSASKPGMTIGELIGEMLRDKAELK